MPKSLVDAYLMPQINDRIDQLGNAMFITTLDLTCGTNVKSATVGHPDTSQPSLHLRPLSVSSDAFWPAGVDREMRGPISEAQEPAVLNQFCKVMTS